ncbi:hypothetical protein DSM106972_071910 [Dulcicalothrix desertica PCC 7102]|uniref:Uncharacterized protein n=1 Tax=Dulcicalothrix desertica PCC 7102 TaxID=232991 RepID=A0A433V3V2_9CYAN|nr:hypothetical protein [Dulcicalothrix desertica]RUT00782.1 hypothetical protein DSM106972_071910 [Dulcicalothrix desertica PCC 7102]TWH42375.1 hypothetical protein CAL7102_06025 [Dulcicalothrix desertica PCC 7102]
MSTFNFKPLLDVAPNEFGKKLKGDGTPKLDQSNWSSSPKILLWVTNVTLYDAVTCEVL